MENIPPPTLVAPVRRFDTPNYDDIGMQEDPFSGEYMLFEEHARVMRSILDMFRSVTGELEEMQEMRADSPDQLVEKMRTKAYYLRRFLIDGRIGLHDHNPNAQGLEKAYDAFMDLYPWEKPKYPSYGEWIMSTDASVVVFRQAWAARAKEVSSLKDEIFNLETELNLAEMSIDTMKTKIPNDQ